MSGWAEQSLAFIKALLQDLPSTLGLVAVLTLVVGVFCYSVWRCFVTWTESKDWWPRAIPLQKQMLLNFGYTDEVLTDFVALQGYAFIAMTVVHHLMAGALLVPAVVGWEEAGPVGQLMFYAGILLELGFDVWDALRQTGLLLCPGMFTWMTPGPCLFFIISVVCHHSLAIFMIVPMLLNYEDNPSFHRIACALILAAGFSYATGSYKFTLDTSKPGDFFRYKVVVVVQLLVIWYTRAWVWFSEAYKLLREVQAEESILFFSGAVACCVLMTSFNLAILGDATDAAVKWLPRQMPTEETEKMELEKSKSATSFGILARSLSGTTDMKEELNKGPVELS